MIHHRGVPDDHKSASPGLDESYQYEVRAGRLSIIDVAQFLQVVQEGREIVGKSADVAECPATWELRCGGGPPD